MESEFVDYITMGEKESDMSYVIKGNILKCKSVKTSEELKLLEKELLVLEEKKKKILLWVFSSNMKSEILT